MTKPKKIYNEPIYPPTPLAEIVCAKCAKAFKYVGSIDPLIDFSISKKIECVGKVVDWWPATNEKDEQVVDNLMNKATKDLKERSMKTQISNFELADRLEKNIFLSGEDDEADDYLLEIAAARLRQIEDLKDALEHARTVLTENKPCCHTRDKETGHHIDDNDKCKLCIFEQVLAHIEEVLERA